MKKIIGKAVYKNGKIYFDEKGWELIVTAAKKKHKTVQQIVIAGLKRGFKHVQKA